MRTLNEQLATYASYHRDRRNIATHFVGIPMIVLSAFAFAARPGLSVAGFPVTGATLVLLGGVAFYLMLDVRFGLAMLAVTLPAFAFGTWLAGESTTAWLVGSAGLFIVGWIIQLIGHAFEGKKPAFVDDLVGLLVGPLFLVAEVAFALGLRGDVREAVEAKAGPVRAGRAALQNVKA